MPSPTNDTDPTLAELLDDLVVADGQANDQDVAIIALSARSKGRLPLRWATSYLGKSRK